jgi:DNA-binding MarR family transcriptional regulator
VILLYHQLVATATFLKRRCTGSSMSDDIEKEESLGKLISCLYRYSQMYLGNELEQYHIGSGQFSFLKTLLHEDGIHQEDVAHLLKIDKATCTRAVKKLMKEGYTTRQKDAEDKRAYNLFLTEKAHSIECELETISSKWKALLLSGFEEDEKVLVMRFLTKMVKNASSLKGDTDE